MKLVIEIEMENAAFGETAEERQLEVNRILENYLSRLQSYGVIESVVLRDLNGNKVGYVTIKK